MRISKWFWLSFRLVLSPPWGFDREFHIFLSFFSGVVYFLDGSPLYYAPVGFLAHPPSPAGSSRSFWSLRPRRKHPDFLSQSFFLPFLYSTFFFPSPPLRIELAYSHSLDVVFTICNKASEFVVFFFSPFSEAPSGGVSLQAVFPHFLFLESVKFFAG